MASSPKGGRETARRDRLSDSRKGVDATKGSRDIARVPSHEVCDLRFPDVLNVDGWIVLTLGDICKVEWKWHRRYFNLIFLYLIQYKS